MRSIISAIMSALKSAFGFAATALFAPFRYLFSPPGGGPVEVPMPAPFEAPAEKQDMTKFYDQIARLVMSWAVDSIIADAPMAMPPKIPREVRAWMQGLTRDECAELMEAESRAVSSHIRGIFAIPGVRKLQPLRAAAWPPEAPTMEHSGFAAIAVLEGLELDRA